VERDPAGADSELQRGASAGELREELDRCIDGFGVELFTLAVVVHRGDALVEVAALVAHGPNLRARAASNPPAVPTGAKESPVDTNINTRESHVTPLGGRVFLWTTMRLLARLGGWGSARPIIVRFAPVIDRSAERLSYRSAGETAHHRDTEFG
jgi:hypothetical protein